MTDSQPVMYGIANCDTIKKARGWLAQHAIDYHFHDYRKQGVDKEQLRWWVAELGWQSLINKRGTSWRKLEQSTKDKMDDQLAISVMLDNPSIIKRPLLIHHNGRDDQKILGFDEASYQQELLKK